MSREVINSALTNQKMRTFVYHFVDPKLPAHNKNMSTDQIFRQMVGGLYGAVEKCLSKHLICRHVLFCRRCGVDNMVARLVFLHWSTFLLSFIATFVWSETKPPPIIIDPSIFDEFETEPFENNDVFQCKSTVELMIDHNGQLKNFSELSFGLRIKNFNQEEAHVVFIENFPTILFETKDHERFILMDRLHVVFRTYYIYDYQEFDCKISFGELENLTFGELEEKSTAEPFTRFRMYDLNFLTTIIEAKCYRL